MDAMIRPASTTATTTLAAALLGFFVVTLDAVVVNVALPSVGRDLGGGLAGLQWVVDGYTLSFAALLLCAGSLTDRIGAKHAFVLGVGVFTLASLACGLASSLLWLIAGRVLQGAAAAVIMPSSMTLVRHAYPDAKARAHAVAIWALGGSVAATFGPIAGGYLTALDWRWIFLINLPVGVLALAIVSRSPSERGHATRFHWLGQLSAIVAMASVTYGAIEAGQAGLGAVQVVLAFAVAAASTLIFVRSQRRPEAMVPKELWLSRNALIAFAVGFTFMVGYFGLPFVMSLYLQQVRGLSPVATGAAFVPMMLVGLLLTPFSARLSHQFGPKRVIVTGLVAMAAGLVLVAWLVPVAPIAGFATAMTLVGLAGPLVSPPVTAVLLDTIAPRLAGVASGLFNTSRQLGGALSVAVFGALLAQADSFETGMRISLVLAAVIAIGAAATSLSLHPRA